VDELDQPNGLPGSALSGADGLAAWQAIIRGAYGPSAFSMERPDRFHGHYRRSAGSPVSAISGNISRVRTEGSACQWDDGQSVFVVISQGGEADMRQDGASLLLRPGDIAIADPQRCWDYRFSGSFGHLSVVAPRSLLALHPEGPDAAVLWHRPARSLLARAVASLSGLIAGADAADGAGDAQDLHAAMLDLLAGAMATSFDASAEHVQRAEPQFRRALRAVDDHLTDPDLSAAKIASLAGMSLRTLYRLFQQRGLTFTSHILARRLEHCLRQLRNPRYRDRSISEIAYGCGFNDLSHFSRSFRRRFGVTPGAARGLPDPVASRVRSPAA
jgi:AraC-like DNA-binding protein